MPEGTEEIHDKEGIPPDQQRLISVGPHCGQAARGRPRTVGVPQRAYGVHAAPGPQTEGRARSAEITVLTNAHMSDAGAADDGLGRTPSTQMQPQVQLTASG